MDVSRRTMLTVTASGVVGMAATGRAAAQASSGAIEAGDRVFISMRPGSRS